MRTYNRFVLSVGGVLMLTTVILAAVGADSLRAYYSLYVLAALIIAQAFVQFSPRARRGLGLVSGGLFAGFLGIVLAEALRALA